MKHFILDGIEGSIDSDGWIEWHTVGCWLNALADCKLQRAALAAH